MQQPQITIGLTFTEYVNGTMIKLWEVEREITRGIYSCIPLDEEYKCQFSEEEILKLIHTKIEKL